MKYLYLLTALIFIGCSDKSTSVQKVAEPKSQTVVSEVKNVVVEAKEVLVSEPLKQETVVAPSPAQNVTMVEEAKVTKNIGSDIPTSCVMWSDGSNVCTRISQRKASCTTNPIGQKMFSCLQWQ